MRGQNTFKRTKRVVSRGGSSRESETPSTPIHPDSTCEQTQEENECSGTQQSPCHSTCEPTQTPNDGIWLIDEQGVPVRRRGRTTCIDIQNMPPGTRVHIEVNEILYWHPYPSQIGELRVWSPLRKKMLAEVEERAAMNADNAKKQTCPHTMGRAIKDRLLLWRINRLHKDDTWSSEDAKQRWIQACELLAEDGNVEANERVFNVVMGPEHPGRVRTQVFGVTSTRYFPHSTNGAEVAGEAI